MTRRDALLASTCLPFVRSAFAFQAKKRASPHETVSLTLGDDKIEIAYGRPYLKGRQVGKEVAPNGEVWRLGADEATKLTVSAKTTLGSLEVPAGSYALFAIPGPAKWTIIVNKTADQWGAFNYDKSQDLGRFEVNVSKASSPAEQFTIVLSKDSATKGKATLSWGTETVSFPLSV